METRISPTSRCRRAFSLVELLVVMAVIATLAAMIFPAAAIIKKNAAIKKVQTEMRLLEVALTAYQANLGLYPPDNSIAPELNPLYYELSGAKLVNGNEFETEGGEGRINTGSFNAFFGGNKITGFVNVSRGSGDDVQKAKNFLLSLKQNSYLEVANGGAFGTVLGTTVKGPLMLSDTNGVTINPWRYTSSSATNNPGKYDLWVDVILGGKTNRISNWNDRAQIVAY